MDSCCFIDVAKYDLGHKDKIDHLADKEEHIKACIKMLDDAKKGNIRVLTGNITISECQHLSGFVDDDSIFIAERARNLMWDYQIKLGGADAHHVATALESGCSEFITSDKGILKWAAEIEKLGLKVIRAEHSKELAQRALAESAQQSLPTTSAQNSLFGGQDNEESN
jgi:predicted nucleic acid-binding protein